MAQLLGRAAAVQHGRLQHRVAGNGALRAGGIEPAPRLALEIPVPADMVGVGVGIVDGGQVPAVFLHKLPGLAAGILVAAAVDEAHVRVVQPHKTNLGGTLHIIAAAGYLNKLVHHKTLLPYVFLIIKYLPPPRKCAAAKNQPFCGVTPICGGLSPLSVVG